jgi:AraC-like DNA-binding protein
VTLDGTICQREIRAVGKALAGLVDTEGLAEAIGLEPPLELVTGGRPHHIEALWREVMERSADPTIPLAVGEAIPFGTFEVVDYLASACDTMGEGLERIARYFALITPNMRWEVDGASDSPSVSLLARHDHAEGRLIFLQFTLGVTFGRFRSLLEGAFQFERVALPFPAPQDRSRHEAFFACPVRYDADAARCWFSPSIWRAPLQRREPVLRDILERHARERLANLEAEHDPLATIRLALREQLADGSPKLEVVAKRVAMSTRTLQRRLRDAGTSFVALVEQERQAAATAYLRDPNLAVTDIAFLLGYSEASAFVRAFKRWTGKTPKQHRSTAA